MRLRLLELSRKNVGTHSDIRNSGKMGLFGCAERRTWQRRRGKVKGISEYLKSFQAEEELGELI